MDVTQAIAALIEAFAAQLDAAERGAAAAQDEATSAEAKPENKYDTRSVEASYLARGQAERVASLRQILGFVRALPSAMGEIDGPAGVGRLVGLHDAGDAPSWWFLAPGGGGTVVTVGREEIRVVTPDAPVGAALRGAHVDDEIELNGRTFVVVSVQG